MRLEMFHYMAKCFTMYTKSFFSNLCLFYISFPGFNLSLAIILLYIFFFILKKETVFIKWLIY